MSIKNDKPVDTDRRPSQRILMDVPRRAWFRGSTVNKRPKLSAMTMQQDAVGAVLHGWEPDQPAITSETQITAFGSCFAANISDWLARRNFRVLTRDEAHANAYVVSMGEGMVNSFAIRQQFEWAWENKVFEQPLWHGYKAEEFGYDEDIRLQTKAIFDETDVFILTFGLSEVWYDEPTGNVFWRTIPKDAYDPTRHKFRLSSVAENSDNIRAICELIRKHRPSAKVILTLSPVPLIATFREISCISANSVSKSVLRVALDEVVSEYSGDDMIHYWPSYELVMDVFRQPFMSDNRHPKRPVLDFIMTLFESIWCVQEQKEDDVNLSEAWIRALVASGELPKRVVKLLDARDFTALKNFTEHRGLHENGEVDQARRALLAELAVLLETQERQLKSAEVEDQT
ncbi:MULTISPECIES: GSCFA domain-containing protein [unclassified Ruegeria]|uniref:GSCFA domain-containing protein n=1 Tax=unclassified Ruegeria TaxID=2625375 RepID=UPI001489B75A|nr:MULTISPECIES: GSCFA domain-containing protein [unclassified Ruegeria]